MGIKPSETMINGRGYAWADITLIILGRKVQGFTAISWNQAREKSNNHGQGDEVVSRTYGNKKANASITLTLKEISAIENVLPPNTDILDIKPFPILVNYRNDQNQFISYQLQHAEFLEFGHDGNQGDMKVEKSLPLIISRAVRLS